MYVYGWYSLCVTKTGPSKYSNLYLEVYHPVYHTRNETHYFHGIHSRVHKRRKFINQLESCRTAKVRYNGGGGVKAPSSVYTWVGLVKGVFISPELLDSKSLTEVVDCVCDEQV